MVAKTLKQLPKPHKWMLSAAAGLFLVSLLLPSDDASASKHTSAVELQPNTRYPLDIKLQHLAPTTDAPVVDDEPEWQVYTVRNGDSLAKVFKRAGLSAKETHEVSRAGEHAKRLLKIMPGDKIHIALDQQKQFSALMYPLSALETLIIDKQDTGYVSNIERKEVEHRYSYAQGEIRSNFWNAAVEAGLTDNQIMSLAAIFGWDIDFALEIRQGDTFNVVFEEQYAEGVFVGYGNIVAAEFVNQGDEYRAIRYTDGNYYTPEGRSMRKSFLRAPVNFSYISSNFTTKRFHPVQKRWKAHRGTDYAANRGTPVMAAGDGKVIRSSYDRFNGHHVFIQHGEKYQTKYLHFTKRMVKVGDTVKQGQVIGTVGSTGLASGPHLHYEFLVDGVHRNPRTVQLPKAEPIDASERSAFELLAERRLQQLNTNKRIMLAMN
ncbi:peptidoglycan DD-metalloendopeptidase family protein [Aestuariibacter salexigens]|uniref:OapA family protein n=1 Tax=Aestuariibacter salexigens TaxID=226010 RepID=UPI00047DC508